jgi:hypothetical protein
MLRPYSLIQIKQVTPFVYNQNGESITISRDLTLNIDFVEEYEIESSWENHTNTATVTFPKNIVLKFNNDKFTPMFQSSGTYSVILGGTQNDTVIAPLLMRGDIISIFDGYRFKNQAGIESTTGLKEKFKGFISKVASSVPIVVECQDSFYLLKKTPIGITSLPNGEGNLYKLIKQMINQCNSKVIDKLYPGMEHLKISPYIDNATQEYSLGYLDIDYNTMSCSKVLELLRQKYGIESTFVGNLFFFGNPIYVEDIANVNGVTSNIAGTKEVAFFDFQNNILESDIEYNNKQDVVLTAIVKCQTNIPISPQRITKKGLIATRRILARVYVYWDEITSSFRWNQITAQKPLQTLDNGEERHEFVYPVNPNEKPPTVDMMGKFGADILKKYYYNGFKGSITTFGFPFVEWNDNINLVDSFISDRNGQYKVRSVKYTGGVKGLRQIIKIDFKQAIEEQFPSKSIYML